MRMLTDRGMEFVDKFIPPLLSSYACHIINLENRKRRFFYMHDRVPDLRLNILIVSPPGFGRSFNMKQLIDDRYGILNCGNVPMRFEGFSTEAGLIGSNEKVQGQTVKIEGLFEEFKDGIIAIEEFFSLSQAMEQQHSSHLEPALNQVLLDGDVRKRLRGGKIEYHTDVTLWAGTQTTRFKVGGGLLRRFLLVNWVPSKREEKLMKRAFRRGINLKLDPQRLTDYRRDMIDFKSDVGKIKKITFSDDLLDAMDHLTHYNEAIMRKYALGYNLMVHPLESDFLIDIDPRLKILIDRAEENIKVMVGDPESDLIIKVMKENGGKMKWEALKKKLIDFSMRFEATDEIIQRMRRSRSIMYEYGTGYLYLPEVWFKKQNLTQKRKMPKRRQ